MVISDVCVAQLQVVSLPHPEIKVEMAEQAEERSFASGDKSCGKGLVKNILVALHKVVSDLSVILFET